MGFMPGSLHEPLDDMTESAALCKGSDDKQMEMLIMQFVPSMFFFFFFLNLPLLFVVSGRL